MASKEEMQIETVWWKFHFPLQKTGSFCEMGVPSILIQSHEQTTFFQVEIIN